MSHFFSPFDENALHYDNCVQFLEDSAVEDGAFLPLVVFGGKEMTSFEDYERTLAELDSFFFFTLLYLDSCVCSSLRA
jgi:hypothetical protein